MKTACVLVILVFAAPAAAALPTASVRVGPADHPDSYYLWVNLSGPEAPRSAKAQDDCAENRRPNSTSDGVEQTLEPFTSSPPPFTESGSTDPYVPDCVAVPVAICQDDACASAVPAYASYNVRTGRYYLDVDQSAFIGPLPLRTHAVETTLTGTTGGSAEGDCKTCPPPGLD